VPNQSNSSDSNWLIEQSQQIIGRVHHGNVAAAAMVAQSHRLIEKTKAKIERTKERMGLMPGKDGVPKR
jgi:hypothetical protein